MKDDPSPPLVRPKTPPRRVVLVEDHTAILELMKSAIEQGAAFRVTGCARDLARARELCRRERPDVVILDPGFPSGPGLALLRELRSLCPRSRIIVFSANLRPGTIRAALLGGAHGLVEKEGTLREFHEALWAVAAGRVYFSRFVAETIRIMIHGDPGCRTRLVRLTDREKGMLRLIAEGLCCKEIAARLGVSPHTVVNCKRRIVRKTGLSGAARLARYAAQMGLVPAAVEGAAEPI